MCSNTDRYNEELNKILHHYENEVQNEKYLILSSQFTIGPYEVQCGFSKGRQFSPAVLISSNNLVLSMDEFEWKTFIELIESNGTCSNFTDLHVSVWNYSEAKIVGVSKNKVFLFFTEAEVAEMLRLNIIIANKIKMLNELHFKSYYCKFLECVHSFENPIDIIKTFCINSSYVQSYAMLECIHYYEKKVLSDVNKYK